LVPELVQAARLLDRAERALGGARDASAGPGREAMEGLRFHIASERADVFEALRLAAGIVGDAIADSERLVPGGEFNLELIVWNGGGRPVAVRTLEPVLPAGWTATPQDELPGEPLPPGQLARRRFRVQVPADAPPTEPYHLRSPRDGDLYRWPDDVALRGMPFQPAEVRARALVALEGVELPIEV